MGAHKLSSENFHTLFGMAPPWSRVKPQALDQLRSMNLRSGVSARWVMPSNDCQSVAEARPRMTSQTAKVLSKINFTSKFNFETDFAQFLLKPISFCDWITYHISVKHRNPACKHISTSVLTSGDSPCFGEICLVNDACSVHHGGHLQAPGLDI